MKFESEIRYGGVNKIETQEHWHNQQHATQPTTVTNQDSIRRTIMNER